MSEVWIVMIEDRHADVAALPYSTEEGAIASARALAAEYAQSSDDVQEAVLTDGMRRDGWVFYLPYGAENDCVRVIRCEMDAR